jgi:hypothetical protein
MRRSPFILAAATALLAGGCSNGQVAVTVALEVPDPDQEGALRKQVLDDIQVQLLPFDRDLVFDSLAAAADAPEPTIPADVLEAQDSIAQAQARWQALETRWGTLRDTLQAINEIMEDYSPAEARYRELYRLYGDLESEYNRVDTQKGSAFERFDSIQQANLGRQAEIRVQQDNWAADAFADIDAVFLAKVREAGAEIRTDTTDIAEAGGTVLFDGLSSGTWWVHARYELPFSELYWNEPVEVGGEPTVIELNRSNAEERPKL